MHEQTSAAAWLVVMVSGVVCIASPVPATALLVKPLYVAYPRDGRPAPVLPLAMLHAQNVLLGGLPPGGVTPGGMRGVLPLAQVKLNSAP